MKKILVTTDGSDNSKKAVLQAKKLAEVLGGRVDILSVVKDTIINPYDTLGLNIMQKASEEFRELGNEILKESLKLFDGFEGEVNTKLKEGDPADIIIDEAEKEKYDLIVMGSRGLGTFSRAMLGSVSNKVLNHVQANVLIVK